MFYINPTNRLIKKSVIIYTVKMFKRNPKFMKHKLLLSLGTVLTATFSFPLIAS
nr:variable surface lipoprotein [Mycoplasmopsis bovis]